MNKKIFILGSLPFLITSFSLISCQAKTKSNPAKEEFNGYIEHLENFPCSFIYNGVSYQGLDTLTLKSHNITTVGVKENHTLIFSLDVLEITVDANYYDGYDAFDWTLYFKNTDANNNSKILSKLNGLDYKIEGANARLKGIYGDHEKQYEPYEFDFNKRVRINWRNELGRATHRYFPYFNVENDKGGALLALGWAGTWESDFEHDLANNVTRVKFNGPVDLATYLKPNEVVRSPLNAVVRYYERDEDKAMNKWRRWYIDCNMPYQDKTHTMKAQPLQAFCLAGDNDNPFSDGSISETYETYKPSLDCLYNKNIRVDLRWFDAGWYLRPDQTPTNINDKEDWKTNHLDWWGTVGTWEMDTGKWPMLDTPSGKKISSFKQSVDYAADHNTMTMVWYEPERVASGDNPEKPWLDKLITNYGFDKSWILKNVDSDHYHTNIVNLGNPLAYNWLKEKIITSLKVNGIKIYREDFNCDPSGPFHNTDLAIEGENRIGITENLYYQNHYKLWDEIIKTTSEDNNGCAFVDACASGGGRNDLESMRRGVPMLRSDADRTTIPLRLAFSYSLNPWLPYTGCSAQESAQELVSGYWDQYVLRASYMSVMTYGSKFQKIAAERPGDYDILRAAQSEWDKIKHYFYKDYYNLTRYTSPTDDTQWNAYMYFDNEKDDGVIQVFRQEHSEESNKILKIKGVIDNHNYKIIDEENKNGIASISGAKLKEGITINLDKKRGSSVLFIKPL